MSAPVFYWADLDVGEKFSVPYPPGWAPDAAQKRVVSTFWRWRTYKSRRLAARIKTRQTDRGILVERVA